MNIKKVTLNSLFWKLFERGGRAIIELLLQIIMARLLVPEQFGMLSIMLVFVNVGNVIVQSGLNTALIQAPDTRDSDYTTVFWMSLAVSFFLYVGIFCLRKAWMK